MMPVQARAKATRRRIIDTAVELFGDRGYGETGLADILQRAEVSKGAFYYHFESKEAVAAAIIEDYGQRNADAIRAAVDPGAPMLDRVIVASFTSAAMLETDATAFVGNQLLQALGQVSSVACRIYSDWTEQFVGTLSEAIGDVGDLDGEQAVEAAEAMWTGVLGCQLLSSALNDDPYTRLSRAWRSMLRATVPEESLSRYLALLDRVCGDVRGSAHRASRIRAQGLAASNS